MLNEVADDLRPKSKSQSLRLQAPTKITPRRLSFDGQKSPSASFLRGLSAQRKRKTTLRDLVLKSNMERRVSSECKQILDQFYEDLKFRHMKEANCRAMINQTLTSIESNHTLAKKTCKRMIMQLKIVLKNYIVEINKRKLMKNVHRAV